MPGKAPICVVRPFYVHSKEIKQTNEQRHPKLNRRDDIVTCRHGTLLETPQLATKCYCFKHHGLPWKLRSIVLWNGGTQRHFHEESNTGVFEAFFTEIHFNIIVSQQRSRLTILNFHNCEVFAVLDSYAAFIGSYLTTFRESIGPLKNGTDKLSRNVGNYQSTLHHNSEQRRSHSYGDGSLKSRIRQWCCVLS